MDLNEAHNVVRTAWNRVKFLEKLDEAIALVIGLEQTKIDLELGIDRAKEELDKLKQGLKASRDEIEAELIELDAGLNQAREDYADKRAEMVEESKSVEVEFEDKRVRLMEEHRLLEGDHLARMAEFQVNESKAKEKVEDANKALDLIKEQIA